MAVAVSMMTIMFDTARRTLVVGLGKTGLSVARFCRSAAWRSPSSTAARAPGLETLRTELPADVALFLGGFKAEAFERAEQVIVSPGVSVREP
jgi:UDP-N-acetylmuramoylalanine--D-glutamate ligase